MLFTLKFILFLVFDNSESQNKSCQKIYSGLELVYLFISSAISCLKSVPSKFDIYKLDIEIDI